MTPRQRRAHWRTDTHRFRYDPGTGLILIRQHRHRTLLQVNLDQLLAIATPAGRTASPAIDPLP